MYSFFLLAVLIISYKLFYHFRVLFLFTCTAFSHLTVLLAASRGWHWVIFCDPWPAWLISLL